MLMLNVLSSIDLFGVPYLPTIKGKKNHKTGFGGVLSLLITCISLAYFFYIIIQWQSGQFSPKVTQMQKNFQYKTFQEQELIEVKFSNFLQFQDPFAIKNNIITPLIIHVSIEKMFSDIEPLFDYIDENKDDLHTRKIKIKHKLVQNIDFKKSEEPAQYALVGLVRCQQQYLPKGGYCASDEEIEAYLLQPQLMIDITFKLKQFNPTTSQVEAFDKPIYQLIDPRNCLYNEMLLKPVKVQINEGLLFYSEKTEEFLGDVNIMSQTVTYDYVLAQLKMKFFYQILLRLDYVEDNFQVSYLRLGEILAEIGSITSVLFSLQFVIIMFNQFKLEQHILQEIFTMYFPSFNRLKITKNCLGKAKTIEDENNRQYDPIQYNEFKSKTFKVLQQKLDFLSIIKEMTKIQMALKLILSKEDVLRIKKGGIDLMKYLQIKGDRQKIQVQENVFRNIQISNDEEIQDQNADFNKNGDINQSENQNITNPLRFDIEDILLWSEQE